MKGNETESWGENPAIRQRSIENIGEICRFGEDLFKSGAYNWGGIKLDGKATWGAFAKASGSVVGLWGFGWGIWSPQKTEYQSLTKGIKVKAFQIDVLKPVFEQVADPQIQEKIQGFIGPTLIIADEIYYQMQGSGGPGPITPKNRHGLEIQGRK